MPAKPKACRFCEAIDVAYEPLHVITVNGTGQLTVGGKAVEKATLIELKEGVALLRSNPLWKVLLDNLKNSAIEVGFRKSSDFDQVLVGKAMSYAANVLEATVKVIENAKSE